mmetsp:Transcript_3602/g.5362  ORF Transcript_3602/g.5362 Transcript_3602/m.5362 type:complete len:101 (-) Transcript_3602:1653-1955(-)
MAINTFASKITTKNMNSTNKKIAMGAALPASGLLNIEASTFPNIIVYNSNKDVPKLQNGNGGSDGDTHRLVPRKTVTNICANATRIMSKAIKKAISRRTT